MHSYSRKQKINKKYRMNYAWFNDLAINLIFNSKTWIEKYQRKMRVYYNPWSACTQQFAFYCQLMSNYLGYFSDGCLRIGYRLVPVVIFLLYYIPNIGCFESYKIEIFLIRKQGNFPNFIWNFYWYTEESRIWLFIISKTQII